MNKKTISIKNARIKDIEDLINLLKQLFSIEKDFTFDAKKHHKGLQMMLDGCGKYRIVKVAWIDHEIVGMCTAQTSISTASGSMAAMLEDIGRRCQIPG
ncbi:MAG: hypothetical protein ABIJ59_17940 [Pseudomonadota bacterium]